MEPVGGSQSIVEGTMMILSMISLAMSVNSQPDNPVDRFVEAESGFSKLCVEKGLRESFLHFFAPEAIAFNPEAHDGRKSIEESPVESLPLPYRLAWEPRVADCASTGDLGFTTGPATVTDLGPDKRPTRNMVYFSIWKRMPDGALKVVCDLGTPMAKPPEFPALKTLPRRKATGFKVKETSESIRAKLVNIEKSIGTSSTDSLASTLKGRYDAGLTAYRTGSPPLLSAGAALAWHRENKLSLNKWEPRTIEVALSTDWAWSYGHYSGALNGQPVTGYWIHVWHGDGGRGWHMVADVLSVIRPKE